MRVTPILSLALLFVFRPCPSLTSDQGMLFRAMTGRNPYQKGDDTTTTTPTSMSPISLRRLLPVWPLTSAGCVNGENIIKYSEQTVTSCQQLCIEYGAVCVGFEFVVDHGGSSAFETNDCQLSALYRHDGVDQTGCDGITTNLDFYTRPTTTAPSAVPLTKPTTTNADDTNTTTSTAIKSDQNTVAAMARADMKTAVLIMTIVGSVLCSILAVSACVSACYLRKGKQMDDELEANIRGASAVPFWLYQRARAPVITSVFSCL